MILAPPAYFLRLVNKSCSPISQVLFKLLLLFCIWRGCLLYWLFENKHSVSYHPLSPTEYSLLIFKVPGVKPY